MYVCMYVFDEQPNHMVFHNGEGPVVGRLLGAPRKKCQTPPKEGTWTVELKLRRTEHDYYRNRKSYKRLTYHLRVPRSREYFVRVIPITTVIRTSSYFNAKRRSLQSPEYESIFNIKGSSSAKRYSTIYKSMAQRVSVEFA